MKKVLISLAIVFVFVLSLGVFSSCSFNLITGTSYDNADKYTIGNTTWADDVDSVEVNWYVGEVEIVETDGTQITITETEDNLAPDKQLRSLVDNGTLKIQFWSSGLVSSVDDAKKNVTIEIPAGKNIKVSTTRGNFYSNSITGQNVFISTTSGDIQINNITCKYLKATSTGGTITLKDVNSETKFQATSISGTINITKAYSATMIVGSTSGTITIDELVCTSLTIESVSSRIQIASLSAKDSTITTTSGKMVLVLTSCETLSIEGISSSISLTLPQEDGATISYSTMSGLLTTNKSFNMSDKMYVFGAGTSQINIQTTSGNLVVK